MNQAFAPAGLVECIGEGAFRLHALEAYGQGAVLVERQAQCLAGDGLLELQFLQGLGYGRRTDHLVLDAVPEVGLIDFKRHPAHHVCQTGLGQHVGDAV